MDHRERTQAPGSRRVGRSATKMIETCFRRQHPEAFGGAEIPVPEVPAGLLFGTDPQIETPVIPEEPMGNASAARW
jgi:hypothetical protein